MANNIVRSNDFGIKICLYQQLTTGEEKKELNCSDIEDLTINIHDNSIGPGVENTFTVNGNTILVYLDGTKLHNGSYSVEVTGKVSGYNIRGAERNAFTIVEYNGQQNITFAPFENEVGGTVPLTFCYYVSSEGQKEWVNTMQDTLNAINDKVNHYIIKHAVDETNVVIKPNNLHVWEKVPSELTVSFAQAESDNSYAEYQMEIHCDQDCSLTLPQNIEWATESPDFITGYAYLISVLNNIGIVKSWKETV